MYFKSWQTLKIIFVLLLVCIYKNVFADKSSNKTLKMVHLLYRHGARSPVKFYPTYTHANDWPDGPGRLTQTGMRLEYELGKFLKERYMINTTFIDQMYLHNEVYVRSSDEERCLQSAEAQLAGLYPPMGRQIWNDKIPWQPVPVHTVLPDHDPLLRPGDTNCPRLDELKKAKKSEALYQQKLKENQDLLKYLTTHSGMDIDFDNLYIISDTYICEKQENITSEKWILDRLDELLNISIWLFLNDYRGDDEFGRLLGGSLLNVISNNMKAMSEKQESLYKMNIFSGHDTSILSLTAALNIEMSVPTFASCIMIELYEDETNIFFVEMVYRNDSSGKLYQLKLDECQFSCPLQDFISLTKNRVTDDQSKICQVKNNKNSKTWTKNRKLILGIIIGSVVLSLVFIFIMYYRCRKSKNTLQVDETVLLISQEL